MVQKQILEAVKIQKTEEMKHFVEEPTTMKGLLEMHSQRERVGKAFNVRVDPLDKSPLSPTSQRSRPSFNANGDGFELPPVPGLSTVPNSQLPKLQTPSIQEIV